MIKENTLPLDKSAQATSAPRLVSTGQKGAADQRSDEGTGGMIQTYGLTHIQLTVRDLERSLRFYQQLLGMKELFRIGSDTVMLQTPGAHEVFTLNNDPEDVKQPGQMGGIAHFGFRLRKPCNMDTVLEEIARAGGTPIKHGVRGKDKEELWAFLTDPDGYEIEIFWAPS